MRPLKERVIDTTRGELMGRLAVIWVLAVAVNILTPADSTDAGVFSRSRVKLAVDHATGQEYLETAQGGIQDRRTQMNLDRNINAGGKGKYVLINMEVEE